MITVVFGAGASYDVRPGQLYQYDEAVSNLSNRHVMPMSKDLFSHYFSNIVFDKYKKANQLAALVRRRVQSKESLEEALTSLINTKKGLDNKVELMSLDMRCYIRDLIIEIQKAQYKKYKGDVDNNYQWIVADLQLWAMDNNSEVNFISFNYDTYLEKYIYEADDIAFKNINNYIERDSVFRSVYKPHGSVNWYSQIDDKLTKGIAGIDFEDIQNMLQNSEIIIRDRPLSTDTIANGRVPQIAIPVTDKYEAVMPPSHYSSMKNTLEDSKHIFIIGWRGAETQAREYFEACNDDVRVYVGGSNKKNAQSNINENLKSIFKKSIKIIPLDFNGFSDLTRKTTIEELIKP